MTDTSARTRSAPAFKDVLADPTDYFEEPGEVLTATAFSDRQKAEILRQWKDECIQLMRATEENMGGGEHNKLGDVERALETLERR